MIVGVLLFVANAAAAGWSFQGGDFVLGCVNAAFAVFVLCLVLKA